MLHRGPCEPVRMRGFVGTLIKIEQEIGGPVITSAGIKECIAGVYHLEHGYFIISGSSGEEVSGHQVEENLIGRFRSDHYIFSILVGNVQCFPVKISISVGPIAASSQWMTVIGIKTEFM